MVHVCEPGLPDDNNRPGALSRVQRADAGSFAGGFVGHQPSHNSVDGGRPMVRQMTPAIVIFGEGEGEPCPRCGHTGGSFFRATWLGAPEGGVLVHVRCAYAFLRW